MNKIILVGKLNYKENKEKFTSFQVSTLDGWGEKKKWNNHKCVVFGRIKGFIDNFVENGNIVELVGELSYSKKDDKTYTNIIVNEINTINSPTNNNNNNSNDDNNIPF